MSNRKFIPTVAVMAGLVALVAVACTGGSSSAVSVPTPTRESQPTVRPTAESAAQPTAAPNVQPTAQATVEPTLTSEAQASPQPAATPTPSSQAVDDVELPAYMRSGWKTDFSKHSVPYKEIKSGGPGRDGIPPIDDPEFAKVSEAPDYMRAEEPVISLEIGGQARAYPLSILIGHEIVNDEVGGVPVSVTYCPLCNTSIVFDRRVGDMLLDFGVSGNLRASDLVMWDRQTESWWQQITGEAIVGELTGTTLTFIPAPVISWERFSDSFPDGDVLTRPVFSFRNYDLPPYAGYDTIGSRPFLFRGAIDPRLDAMERVVALSIDGEQVAYPFMLLEEHPVVNDSINGQDVVVFFLGGTLSPFAGSGRTPNRVIGSTVVYIPTVDGQTLTFAVQDDVIVDEQTGSSWDILGNAVDGPLAGSRLTPVVHGNHFWFA